MQLRSLVPLLTFVVLVRAAEQQQKQQQQCSCNIERFRTKHFKRMEPAALTILHFNECMRQNQVKLDLVQRALSPNSVSSVRLAEHSLTARKVQQ